MSKIATALSQLVTSVIAFVVMIILAVISFYFTIFVIVTGANIAGVKPGGDFVVLSAAILTAAALLAGGLSPVTYLGQPMMSEHREVSEAPADD